MLSFREVHTNATAPQPLPGVFVAPGIYRPTTYPHTPPGGAGGPETGAGNGQTGASTQALYYLANCDAAAQVGQAVYVTGPNAVAVADCQRPDAVVGLITSKRSPTTVVVQTAGEVVLGLSGLSPGVDYFLGGNGMLSPPPLTGILFVQRIGMATTGSRLYLQLDGHVVRRDPA